MSSISERSHSPEPADYAYSPEKLVDLLFGGKLVPYDGDKPIHDFLKVIYKLKPECFQPTASIHNSGDGKETYQSMKVWITKDFYHTIHAYGIMRGKQFKVTYLSIKNKDLMYRINFVRPDGGGGGGGSRYSRDKSPW